VVGAPQLSGWYAVLYALLLAGFGKFIIDVGRYVGRAIKSQTPQAREDAKVHRQVELANASVVTVSRSTERLEHDNDRLRAEITEMATRCAADRAAWSAERTSLIAQHAAERTEYRAEITALRDEIEELEDKWRAALDQVALMREQVADLVRRTRAPRTEETP
jgi:predicted  nucleic acid-binding Zn-ribbon protein